MAEGEKRIGLRLNYKYVIFGADSLYYVAGYYGLKGVDGVAYLTERDSVVWRLLYGLAFSVRVPRVLRSIFRPLVYPFLYPHPFGKDEPICFLFFGSKALLFGSSYMDYLDARYKNAKKVLYMQDIVSVNDALDIEQASALFDVMLSYDKADAEKYGMVYHPTPYSLYPVPNDESFEESDLFFCGLAKSKARYDYILKCYDACTQKGLKPLFFVSGVDEAMERREGIIYNRTLTYEQILRYVKRTKCIVEAMQDGAVGCTPRTWEAIIYDKHLLTNNKELLHLPYYNASYMHFGDSDLQEMDRWIPERVEYSLSEKEVLSPLRLLEVIDDALSV